MPQSDPVFALFVHDLKPKGDVLISSRQLFNVVSRCRQFGGSCGHLLLVLHKHISAWLNYEFPMSKVQLQKWYKLLE